MMGVPANDHQLSNEETMDKGRKEMVACGPGAFTPVIAATHSEPCPQPLKIKANKAIFGDVKQ